MSNINCPICNRLLQSKEICDQCGWEYKIILSSTPQKYIDFETKRIEIAQKAWQLRLRTESKLRDSNQQVEILTNDNNRVKKEAAKLTKDLAEKYRNEDSLNSQIEIKDRTIMDLRDKLKEASQIEGISMMLFDPSNSHVYKVHDGVNLFGTSDMNSITDQSNFVWYDQNVTDIEFVINVESQTTRSGKKKKVVSVRPKTRSLYVNGESRDETTILGNKDEISYANNKLIYVKL